MLWKMYLFVLFCLYACLLIFLAVGAWCFFLDTVIDRIRLFFPKRQFLRRYTHFFLNFCKLEDICL